VINGAPQPAPAPRFSRTPATVAGPPTHVGEDTDAALAEWGFSDTEITALRATGAIA
jgi:alpha-methylacyl-CoA racemase